MGGRAGDPRNTSRWQKLRREIIGESDLCWICGHAGAGDVDHLVPIEAGGDAFDRSNLAPAHGWKSKCWQCDRRTGKACNQGRNGNRRKARPVDECHIVRDGYGRCTERVVHLPPCPLATEREVW